MTAHTVLQFPVPGRRLDRETSVMCMCGCRRQTWAADGRCTASRGTGHVVRRDGDFQVRALGNHTFRVERRTA